MPNGFHGSKVEWEKLVAPLRELDEGLDSFAAARGLKVDHNYHNTPNRMVRWARGGIERVIQITLYGERQILFSFSAFSDEGGMRRGKRWQPLLDIPLAEFKANLETLLAEAHQTLDSVSPDDLEEWT
jgi:hypothetical protein